jgi:hypothetical protein
MLRLMLPIEVIRAAPRGSSAILSLMPLHPHGRLLRAPAPSSDPQASRVALERVSEACVL